MSKNLFVILITILIGLTSCENENTVNVKKNNVFTLSLGSEEDIVAKNYINSFNLENVIGVIEIHKTFKNQINNNIPYQGYANLVYANFYDNNGDKLELGSIGINNLGLENVGNFSYQNHSDNLNLNFGTGVNQITISDNNGNTLLDTNISCFNPTLLTNFTPNQNISKSNDLTLNWSNSNSSVISQIFMNTDSGVLNTDSVNTFLGIETFCFTNNGSHTIRKESFNTMTNGKTELIMSNVHLQLMPLSNGKKVAILTRFTYDSYVNITN